ncbi:MAG: peptidoglycan bridge formation glycyltransferase FemA/FemB family protein [Anaerolineae bacterium]|nr:peptidoglycan bridge formation glycyltransferase FemA/FemB family protein [Anaerolineae bacterium]
MTHPPTQWDNFITAHHGHLLQSWAWGELKSRFGWIAQRIQVDDAAAQILFRRLPLGLTIAYIPKGPVVDWSNWKQGQALFAAIHAEVKKHRAVFLKVEPDVGQTPNYPTSQATHASTFLQTYGFIPADTIQPRTSLVIDLGGDEDAILAAMKQKARYNIRLSAKKGVTVREGNKADVSIFYNLSLATSDRDGFEIHSLDYYQTAYNLFAPHNCSLLIAEFEGKPLSAVMVFCQAQDAYYFYGASANENRHLMPNYLVQWAAIQWAKNQDCTRYDLWGIPDADPATLEAEFQHRHDGLWGVYRFKRGFGGQFVQSIGAYDYIYNPLVYQLYKLYRRY